MDTILMKCFADIFGVFLSAAGPDGKISGEDFKKLIEQQFGQIIRENKVPESIKELLKKAEPYIKNGCTKEDFAKLICFVFHDFVLNFDKLTE